MFWFLMKQSLPWMCWSRRRFSSCSMTCRLSWDCRTYSLPTISLWFDRLLTTCWSCRVEKLLSRPLLTVFSLPQQSNIPKNCWPQSRDETSSWRVETIQHGDGRDDTTHGHHSVVCSQYARNVVSPRPLLAADDSFNSIMTSTERRCVCGLL